MFHKRLFYFVLALSLTLAALFSRSSVSADSDNVTSGDVQALLRTWNSGLRALRFISGNAVAAPIDGFQRGLIHAFGSDGAHVCVEDWHVILTAWVTGDESFTYQQAVVDLTIESTFILDGEVLPINETPVVRRVVPLFFKDEFGYALGSILSPADLAVGEHTLTYVFTFLDGSSESNTIVFFVDPSGSGACVP
jgi:hypothetical protein